MIYVADIMVDETFIAKYIFEIPDEVMLIKAEEFEKAFCKKHRYKKAKLLLLLPL